MLNALPALVGYWDSALRNRMANDAYIEFFGKSPEQMRGTHIRELLGPEVYEQSLPYIEGALAGETQLFYREIPKPSGEVRYTQASYIPDVSRARCAASSSSSPTSPSSDGSKKRSSATGRD